MMLDMKADAKKKSLMELIKTMYGLMDKEEYPDPSPEHEAMESMEEEKMEHDTGLEAMDEGTEKARGKDLLSKSMESASDDFDLDEVRDFLTKRRKNPIGKSIKIMAVEKSPLKKAKKY